MAILGVAATLVALLFVTLLPTWFAITGSWDLYIFWLPIAFTIGRWFFSPLALVAIGYRGIAKGEVNILGILYHIIMIWFGYPLILGILISFVTVPLSPMLFQRMLVQYMTLGSLGIAASCASFSHTHAATDVKA
jgi:hypothetical protein